MSCMSWSDSDAACACMVAWLRSPFAYPCSAADDVFGMLAAQLRHRERRIHILVALDAVAAEAGVAQSPCRARHRRLPWQAPHIDQSRGGQRQRRQQPSTGNAGTSAGPQASKRVERRKTARNSTDRPARMPPEGHRRPALTHSIEKGIDDCPHPADSARAGHGRGPAVAASIGRGILALIGIEAGDSPERGRAVTGAGACVIAFSPMKPAR